MTAGAAGYAVLGMPHEAAETALHVPSSLLLFLGVTLWERRVVGVLLLYSAVEASTSVLREAVYAPLYACASRALQSAGLFAGPVFVLAVVLQGLRIASVLHARALTAGDRARYDAAWRRVVESPGAGHAIAGLQALVRHMESRASVGGGGAAGRHRGMPPRHMNRSQVSTSQSTMSRRSSFVDPIVRSMRRNSTAFLGMAAGGRGGQAEPGRPVGS